MPLALVAATLSLAFIAFGILWKLGNRGFQLTPGNEPEAHSLEKSLFMLMGVYFSVTAIVQAPQLAVAFWKMHHTPQGITFKEYVWLLSVAAQLLIGMSMIARLDKWLAFVRSLGAR